MDGQIMVPTINDATPIREENGSKTVMLGNFQGLI